MVGFAALADHRLKIKENEKENEYLNCTRELKKSVKRERDSDTNSDWCTWNECLVRGLEELEIGGQAETIPTTS